MFELTDKTFNRGFMLETQSGITGGFVVYAISAKQMKITLIILLLVPF
jgi:hypothetical protein